MSNVVKTVAAAALALSFAGYAAAQTQNPNADTRPFPQDGTTTQPYSNEEPTNAPGDPAVGSRAIGPPATGQAPDVAPETPADKNTTNLKKLDKQGRGGQQN